jgi:predicted flap endonuclease-1-like 5' DNA nuclease
MGIEENEVVVARFASKEDAQQALERMEDVLKATNGTLAEGALVMRRDDGEVEVVDLRDTAFSDIVAGAADLTFFIAGGVAKIAFNTAVSGIALLMRGTGRFVDLAGSIVFFPAKKLVRRLSPVKKMAQVAQSLSPGTAALVLEVNERLQSALEETVRVAGGEVIDLGRVEDVELSGLEDEVADVVQAQAAATRTATEEMFDETIEEAKEKAVDAGETVGDLLAAQARAGKDAVDTAVPTMEELEDRQVGQDLSKIEGIGPVIAQALNGAGIDSYADLAAADIDGLRAILNEASVGADPATWPEQAKLAMRGRWDALEALQERLQGGRDA